MNINKYLYSMLAALLGALCTTTACRPDIDDNFSQPAAQRLAQSVEAYDRLLQSADYGWIMNYYPADGSLGGCVYTARFSQGNVELASELRISDDLPVGTPVTSKYRVIEEQGVILTFDTYNEQLHYFSEPRLSDIDGYESDYEFVFRRVSTPQDSIFLTGKRYGTELVMRRMTADDADYIARTIQMNKDLMAVPHFRITVDRRDYPIQLQDLHLIYPTADGDSTLTATFIYTPDGISFYQPVTIGNATFTSLVYDADTGQLRSADGRVVIPYPTNMQQLVNSFGEWQFDIDAATGTGDADDTFLSAFHRPVQYLCTIERAFIGPNPVYPDNDDNECVIGFYYNVFGQYTLYGCYGIMLTTTSDDTVDIVGIDAAYGYNQYYFTPITERLLNGSPYHVEFQPGTVQKRIRLVSLADDSIWFTLKQE
ncbi:MAG: DUF4302 domain-containing protein [Prevotella sp.]|nr:DUF4302 domain-containing protein [Prevotella sp.]MBQ8487989.1 DUF4302 domain-containing protein [Prevotella sp.]